MEVLKIQLVQCTPMWHFEAGLNQCCLRGTEVKPKLDKFLLSRDGSLKKYAIKRDAGTDGHVALDYKLSFSAPESRPLIFKDSRFPLFFGNIKSQKPKKLIFYQDVIDMQIFTLHEGLQDKIRECLKEFFATHSFGTRQDKGFGFFFPLESGKNENEAIEDFFQNDYGADYMFQIELKDADIESKFEEAFSYVNYFHKVIRSGINENGTYVKSLMYHYVKDTYHSRWDKPTIRHSFHLYNSEKKSDCAYEKEKQGCDSKIDFLYRDTLGLATVQFWKTHSKTVVTTSREIARYKSPITYRVAICGNQCAVYIYIDEQKNINGKEFDIKLKPPVKDSIQMTVRPDFSVSNYFDYILKHKSNKDLEKSEIVNKIFFKGVKPFQKIIRK